MAIQKLNLGCGTDIRGGWINLDKVALPGVDIVHNLEKLPLPFEDNRFEEILCQDIFEHIDYIPVLKDLHRIMKPGGMIRIRVPHFTSRRNFDDPTHKRMFSVRTFDYFIKNSPAGREYYFDFHFSKRQRLKITFEKKFYWYNYLVEPLINLHKTVRETIFEATALSRLFPADNIIVELIK